MPTSTPRPRTHAGFFLALGTVSALVGCNPRHESVADCLEDSTLGTELPGRDADLNSVYFVKTCHSEARLRGSLSVAVMVPAGMELRLDDIELFLDGFPIPGLEVDGLGPSMAVGFRDGEGSGNGIVPEVAGHFRTLSFLLLRTPDSRDGWARIVGGERNLDSKIPLRAGVGPGGGPAFPEWPVGEKDFEFKNYYAGGWSVLLFLGALAGTLFAAWMTGKRAVDGKGAKESTFSLSRVLTLYWFLLILGSFLLVYAITGEYEGIITGQALLLLGIQSGTLAGALAIDADSGKTRPERSTTRKQGVAGFFQDILTDGEGHLLLPRAQSLVWHLILGGIFLLHVWEYLWMPEFDDTLLALLGIGNVVYLGGKVGENAKPLRP